MAALREREREGEREREVEEGRNPAEIKLLDPTIEAGQRERAQSRQARPPGSRQAGRQAPLFFSLRPPKPKSDKKKRKQQAAASASVGRIGWIGPYLGSD